LAERIKILVLPQGAQGNLPVEDALRQVVDFFDLLSYSDDPASGEVVWQLIEAKTNSPPFSVVAEAASVTPGVIVDAVAKAQKEKFKRSLSEYKAGHAPSAWKNALAQETAQNFIERIGKGMKTEIDLDPFSPIHDKIILTDKDVAVAEQARYEIAEAEKTTGKKQIGSIEGVLRDVTTYYNKPAVIVTERKTGARVTCIIPEAISHEFAARATFEDVWAHRRVIVRGQISYGKSGEIDSVSATSIDQKEAHPIKVEQIRDKTFTNGLSVTEYLEKLREGELG